MYNNLNAYNYLLTIPILLAFYFLTGCNGCNPCPLGTQITVASNDQTAPESCTMLGAFINDTHPSVSVSNTSGDVGTPATTADAINLTVSGSDPEGVRAVRIWVEVTEHTGNTTSGPGLLAVPNVEKVSAEQAGDKQCIPLRASFDYHIGDDLHNADWIGVRIWGEVENFSGMKVRTGSITFETQH